MNLYNIFSVIIKLKIFQNIVVAGGNTRFWRFDKRLEKELWSLLPIGAASTIKPKVIPKSF